MKKIFRIVSIIIILSLLVSTIQISSMNILAADEKNLLWADTNFSYSYSSENTYGEKFSKILTNKKDLVNTVNITNSDSYSLAEFGEDEKPKCAANGHADSWAFGNDMFKLYPQDGFDSVGVLINLGNTYSISSVVTQTVTQNVSSDWAKNVRLIKGKIYAGNSITALSYVGSFNNTDNTVSKISTELNDKTARYIMILYTDYTIYLDSLWIDEIEILGKEYTFSIPEEHSNLILNNRNAITKLELSNAIDSTQGTFNADLYKSVWTSGKYENIHAAVDGDTATCSTTEGFKPSYINNSSEKLSNIGWLIDLHDEHELSLYRAYYAKDTGMRDTRKQKGVIYIGNDATNLTKLVEFNNANGDVCFDVLLNGSSARYVAVVLTNTVGDNELFNWLTAMRTFMAEIEIYGKKVSSVPLADTNLIYDKKDTITKLTMKEAIDETLATIDASAYKSEWIAQNYDGVGAAVDGDVTNCSASSGFKPTYVYSEDGVKKTYSNIGWLIDLGHSHELSVYRTHYWTDNGKSDTRKQKGIIYIGDNETSLYKVREFENFAGEVSFDVDLTGETARYVAIVLTNTVSENSGFNWYGNLRTFMAEIELYGKEQKGDLNCDGAVDILDLVRLKKYFASEDIEIDQENPLFRSYFGDASCTAAIRRYLLNSLWPEKNTDNLNRANWDKNMVLKTKDDYLVNGYGERVRLRGVNVPTLDSVITGDDFWDNYYLAINEWNCNLLRINLSSRWVPSYGKTTKAQWDEYLSIVDRVVSEAVRNEVYVILDDHPSDLYWMPIEVDYEFWDIMSLRYANCPNVIFGIFNEPHDVTLSQWKNGSGDEEWENPNVDGDFKKIYGMQQLVDVIRNNGADNLISATGVNNGSVWNGFLEGGLLEDHGGNGIMYEIHRYSYANDFDTRYNEVLGKIPLFIGEFNTNEGPYKYGDEIEPWDLKDEESIAFMNSIMDFIEKWDLSFCAWALHSNYPPMLLEKGFPEFIPTASGQIIKDYISEAENNKKVLFYENSDSAEAMGTLDLGAYNAVDLSRNNLDISKVNRLVLDDIQYSYTVTFYSGTKLDGSQLSVNNSVTDLKAAGLNFVPRSIKIERKAK